MFLFLCFTYLFIPASSKLTFYFEIYLLEVAMELKITNKMYDIQAINSFIRSVAGFSSTPVPFACVPCVTFSGLGNAEVPVLA